MRRDPGLMGVTEIQRRIGGSRSRAIALVSRKGFPSPVVMLSQGRVWLEAEVEAWIRERLADEITRPAWQDDRHDRDRDHRRPDRRGE